MHGPSFFYGCLGKHTAWVALKDFMHMKASFPPPPPPAPLPPLPPLPPPLLSLSLFSSSSSSSPLSLSLFSSRKDDAIPYVDQDQVWADSKDVMHDAHYTFISPWC